MSSAAVRAGSVRWSTAMEHALYGPNGFYVAREGAAGHFRTSATASTSAREIFAAALGELLQRVDTSLGHPDSLNCVEVGGGSGDLLEAVLGSLGFGLRSRVRPAVVELRPRHPGLSAAVRWLDAVPDLTGLLFANEWLDNVPIDVLVDGRVLLVDETGVESCGPAPATEETVWLARWWPSGSRREIGLRRDAAWAGALSRVRRGLAVAVDYSHTAADRPAYGTLTGFRRGRETEPIPDGSSDLTAHVAIDSVAAAGEHAVDSTGLPVRTLLLDQRRALRSLGVSGRRPDFGADPGGFAAALKRASDSAELIDPAGLGAFTWLLQGVDLDPAAIFL